MKRYTIVIEGNDTAGCIGSMIQLFIKSLKLRSLIIKANYKSEDIKND